MYVVYKAGRPSPLPVNQNLGMGLNVDSLCRFQVMLPAAAAVVFYVKIQQLSVCIGHCTVDCIVFHLRQR